MSRKNSFDNNKGVHFPSFGRIEAFNAKCFPPRQAGRTAISLETKVPELPNLKENSPGTFLTL
jgi:hypothetical protein